jgi:phenylacetic acid degradation operon negative regulatory protein
MTGAASETRPALLNRLTGPDRPRAKSLIVTVYGDSVLPRGGRCWLGELIALVEPLGLNERVTRTAVYRLVRDGLLQGERVGRRSHYTLTAAGRRQFDSAQARIYAAGAPVRDGAWTLIALPDGLHPSARETLTKELGWRGFARLAPGLMGAARGDGQDDAAEVLGALSLDGRCPVFRTAPGSDSPALPALAGHAWPLEALATAYGSFIARFAALEADAGTLAPQAAHVARTLLIHDYRRALLRDPALPEALLPEGWPGQQARDLTARLYRALSPAAERFLNGALGTPPDPERLARRFA